MLQAVVKEELWVQVTRFRVLGLSLSRRMTVVRLSDGSLFVYAPNPMDQETRHDLDALGPVRFCVCPVKEHALFLEEVFTAYPEARVYAAPGLREKRPDLNFHGVLGDRPEPEWQDNLDQTIWYGPAWGDEAIFLHRKTATLIAAHLFWKPGENSPLGDRLLGLGWPRFPFGFRDKQAARQSIERILTWEFNRIISAHGSNIETGGKNAVRKSYAWLIGPPHASPDPRP